MNDVMNDVMKYVMKYAYILLFISTLVFAYVVYSNFWGNIENFDNETSKKRKALFQKYNEKYYPLSKKLTKEENKLIEKWINKMEKEDVIKNKHISPITFGVTLHKDGHINKSRFGIGTKTKYDEFKKDTLELLKPFDVEKFLPKNYNYYGIAWDIEDNLLKVYGLNKDNTKILCNVYKVERDEQKIITIQFDSEKDYKVGKDKTIMKKDGKNVSQYNTGSSNYPLEFMSSYSKLEDVMKMAQRNDLHLDTYSEYDNKLNLYFD